MTFKMSDRHEYQAGAPPGPGDAPPGAVVSDDVLRSDRLPPGQVRTRKWPVLDAGQPPPIAPERWQLHIRGLVAQPLTVGWSELQGALPRVQVLADFHCVTRWSRLGNRWAGVATRELLARAGPLPQARFVRVHAEAGWTTSLPLAWLLLPDSLLADRHDGELLAHEHGGPVRLVVPRLYAWKSAKWVRELELLAEDQPGYWEQLGYHPRGDPWLQERHRE